MGVCVSMIGKEIESESECEVDDGTDYHDNRKCVCVCVCVYVYVVARERERETDRQRERETERDEEKSERIKFFFLSNICNKIFLEVELGTINKTKTGICFIAATTLVEESFILFFLASLSLASTRWFQMSICP